MAGIGVSHYHIERNKGTMDEYVYLANENERYENIISFISFDPLDNFV